MTYHELVANVLELSAEEQRALLATVARSLLEEHHPHQSSPSLAKRLRGIAKPAASPPSDQDFEDDYTAYLEREYA